MINTDNARFLEDSQSITFIEHMRETIYRLLQRSMLQYFKQHWNTSNSNELCIQYYTIHKIITFPGQKILTTRLSFTWHKCEIILPVLCKIHSEFKNPPKAQKLKPRPSKNNMTTRLKTTWTIQTDVGRMHNAWKKWKWYVQVQNLYMST